MFLNHIYALKNEMYQQMAGGAIGLRLTGVVARILMNRWADLLEETLADSRVVLHMMQKYVM